MVRIQPQKQPIPAEKEHSGNLARQGAPGSSVAGSKSGNASFLSLLVSMRGTSTQAQKPTAAGVPGCPADVLAACVSQREDLAQYGSADSLGAEEPPRRGATKAALRTPAAAAKHQNDTSPEPETPTSAGSDERREAVPNAGHRSKTNTLAAPDVIALGWAGAGTSAAQQFAPQPVASRSDAADLFASVGLAQDAKETAGEAEPKRRNASTESLASPRGERTGHRVEHPRASNIDFGLGEAAISRPSLASAGSASTEKSALQAARSADRSDREARAEASWFGKSLQAQEAPGKNRFEEDRVEIDEARRYQSDTAPTAKDISSWTYAGALGNSGSGAERHVATNFRPAETGRAAGTAAFERSAPDTSPSNPVAPRDSAPKSARPAEAGRVAGTAAFERSAPDASPSNPVAPVDSAPKSARAAVGTQAPMASRSHGEASHEPAYAEHADVTASADKMSNGLGATHSENDAGANARPFDSGTGHVRTRSERDPGVAEPAVQGTSPLPPRTAHGAPAVSRVPDAVPAVAVNASTYASVATSFRGPEGIVTNAGGTAPTVRKNAHGIAHVGAMQGTGTTGEPGLGRAERLSFRSSSVALDGADQGRERGSVQQRRMKKVREEDPPAAEGSQSVRERAPGAGEAAVAATQALANLVERVIGMEPRAMVSPPPADWHQDDTQLTRFQGLAGAESANGGEGIDFDGAGRVQGTLDIAGIGNVRVSAELGKDGVHVTIQTQGEAMVSVLASQKSQLIQAMQMRGVTVAAVQIMPVSAPGIALAAKAGGSANAREAAASGESSSDVESVGTADAWDGSERLDVVA